ncbi:MAG: DUF421 domain-containing protein [Caldilineaceae bacterium]|nr:DUF421 domain-containing protein [Caldilineaceae bacterium]MCB0094853.1 DUF421 domain-containing protein [Caldilineaceae bacterium]MCB9157304.1 DUF421 domain-containing protein [Caldilineaceae bacterium]
MSGDTPIQPFDLHRIFLGDLPWFYTFEVVFRTVIIYVFSLLLVRWLSKRAVGQLSLIEFLLVVALGSAVGDPMFYPNVPLLHAMVVIAAVVLLNRGLDLWITHSDTVERMIEGAPVRLIHNGQLDYDALKELSINRDELFQYLRLQGVEHLGAVREAYMEQNGQLSVFYFTEDEMQAGLLIVPPWELDEPPLLASGEATERAVQLGCARCGYLKDFGEASSLPNCPKCDHDSWTPRVKQVVLRDLRE